MSSSKEELLKIANQTRKIIDPGLQQSQAGTDPSGSCLVCSLVLCFTINKFNLGRADIRGGGDPEFGALDSSGQVRGHYWAEVEMPDGQVFVVDITADQFGYEPIYVELLKDSQLRYRPADQEIIDEHAIEVAADFLSDAVPGS